MFSVGVVGGGFVGSACKLLECEGVEVFVYDKIPDRCYPDNSTMQKVSECDIVMVCVPTPMCPDGSCSGTMLETAVDEVFKNNPNAKIIIRSTVPVGTSERLGTMMMPEFLTEKNWEKDFVSNKRWLLGTEDQRNSIIVQKIFEKACEAGAISYGQINVCKTRTAEMTKYTSNCFLASKTSFFNEVFDMCKILGADFETVRKFTCQDQRIGDSHSNVPGHDGRRGFGGTCLPKDLHALIQTCEMHKYSPVVLNSVKHRNSTIDRSEADWKASDRAFVSENAANK